VAHGATLAHFPGPGRARSAAAIHAAPVRNRTSRPSRIAVAAALLPLCALGSWAAIHRVPGLGPVLAESARAVLGVRSVALLEDLAYDLDDRYNRVARAGDPPEAYWEVPPGSPGAATPEAASGAAAAARAFRPRDVGPVHASVAAAGDGSWVALPDPRRPDDAAPMYKTLLHPDAKRSWSAISIVAVDLEAIELHAAAGRHEPESLDGRPTPERTGLVPEADRGTVVAAFNGGYRYIHGRYGMKLDGVTLLPPRERACVVAGLDDGSLAIVPWEELGPDEARARWWRQTPKCMIDRGRRHAALDDPTDSWGSTVASGTVIRRSALGLSADRAVLYVGIADWVTASALATGMAHAGAHSVAQLDVNFSYPKLLLFEPRAGGTGLVARPLTAHFEFTEDEYIAKAAPRDFFYLTRKRSPAEAR
jgi:hypothetical protein